MSKDAAAHQSGTAAQGVAFLSASHATLLVFGFAVHAVVSRLLDRTDYGRFVVALSAGTWLKVITLAVVVPGLSKIVSEDAPSPARGTLRGHAVEPDVRGR